MSSKINVNPGQYKVAGRERQGEDILQTLGKQKMAQSKVFERFEKNRIAAAQRAQTTAGADEGEGEEPEAASTTPAAARKPSTRKTAAKRTASKPSNQTTAAKGPAASRKTTAPGTKGGAGTRKGTPGGKATASRTTTAKPQRAGTRPASKAKTRKR